MLELIVLNPPRRKTKKKRASRRGHLGAASRWAYSPAKKKRATRKKAKKKTTRKKKSTPKKRKKPVARKKTTRRKTTRKKSKAKRRAPRRKAPRRKTKARRKTTRRRRRYASPGKSRTRTYRPRIKRGRKVSRTTKKRIARVVGRRYARAGRRGSLRLNKGRRRRNPAMGIRGITRQIKDVFTVKTLIGVGQGLIGASLAISIPPMAARLTKQSWLTQGYVAPISSAVASVLASAGASALGFRSAAPKILAGGLLVAGSQALRMILPAQYRKYIPTIGGSSIATSSSLPSLSGRGVGRYMSADQLVAQEAKQLGDWMAMSGVGQAYSVPRSSISGVGDYMNFAQYPTAPQAIGIPSFAPSSGEDF